MDPLIPLQQSFFGSKGSLISNYEHSRYSIMTKVSYYQLFLYEALATFILMYSRNCTNQQNYYLPEHEFLSYLFAVCLAGSLSGANLNPAITLSHCLRKQSKYQWNMLPLYFLAQLVGCLLGLALSEFLNDKFISSQIPSDDGWTNIIRIFCLQVIVTMIIVFFILLISNPNTTFIENQISGYIVTSIIMYAGVVLAPKITAVNPIFVISQATYTAFKGSFLGLSWMILYIIGASIGAVLATILYDKVFEPKINEERMRQRQFMMNQAS